MKKFTQFFQEKIILSFTMCVLLAVVLVSATYGWYAMNHSSKAYGIDLKTGGTGGIKVAIEPDGEDIMTAGYLQKVTVDDKEYAIIPIQLNNFENIQEQMIAPGAYNSMIFYITSLSESIRSYSIKVQLEYKPSAGISVVQKQKIEEIIKDHITVYQEMYTENGIVKFRYPLTYYDKVSDDVEEAKGALKFNKEVPATIYWVWNYEITDVPDYANIPRFAGLDTRSAIRKYDEEDTVLGNYIDGIYFNVSIEGSPEGVGD